MEYRERKDSKIHLLSENLQSLILANINAHNLNELSRILSNYDLSESINNLDFRKKVIWALRCLDDGEPGEGASADDKAKIRSLAKNYILSDFSTEGPQA